MSLTGLCLQGGFAPSPPLHFLRGSVGNRIGMTGSTVVFCYYAYGLTIQSALPLPELPPAITTSIDVSIRVGSLDWSPPDPDDPEICFPVHAQETYLFWGQVGKFLIRNGREVVIEPAAEAEERVVRLPLLGAVMAVLLHQRGLLVMHATSVAVNQQAVAFVGVKGQGKSTTAAALYKQGYPLLADDVVALDLTTGLPQVIPGFPQFRLWADAVTTVFEGDLDQLPRVHPQLDKRACRITEGFATESLPLKRLYVLAGGSVPAIQPLDPQTAIKQLISHSYVARFGNQLLQGQRASLHFQQCMTLAKHAPVCLLERPRSLSLLPDVVQLVKKDLFEPCVSSPCVGYSAL